MKKQEKENQESELIKAKVNPNHHSGKLTGYELINGEYHIAPMYQDQFTALAVKRESIKEIISMVTGHFTEDMKQLNESKVRLWNDIADDLGIDPGEGWHYSNGVIKKQEKEVTQ